MSAKPDRSYTGTVTSVDPKERTLDVKGTLLLINRKFALGDNCAYVSPGHPAGAIGDLRPGEKVTVNYQDASGVRVADRVEQKPMCYSGTVTSIDPATHTMTLHLRMMDKTFQLPDDCNIVLRDNKSGALADVQAGNHVTVTYETPNDQPTARQIAQTSALFTGELTAVDATDRTVKAKTLFGTMTFHLADNCTIVTNGKVGGQLSDLKLGDKLAFSFNDLDGVNIADRIGTAPPQEMETTSVQQMTP
jgi:Cu/Ag efflux protein CusF